MPIELLFSASELFTEQEWVFTRPKLFELGPSLHQRSFAKILAVQVQKVKGAEH